MIDITELRPGGQNGGIKIFVLDILAELKRQAGRSVTLVWIISDCLQGEALTFATPTDEIWVLGSLASSTPSRIRAIGRSPSLAHALMADLVYAPLGWTDLSCDTIPTVGVAVDVLHRDYPDTLPAEAVAEREFRFRVMTMRYARVQCISHWTANRVRHHYPSHLADIFVTHCAVHGRIACSEEPHSSAHSGFLYPANSWVHKNHETLLVGYRQYARRRQVHQWRLILTGFRDGAMERILEQARALGICDKVEFNGYLEEEAFGDLWAQTGALVFASLHEGFGIPVLEAMRMGVPVVADRVGSIPEVAGDACLYTNMRNPTEIAAALERIQTDFSLRKRLVAEGFRRASKFSLEREAGKLLNVFRQCAAETRRRLHSERTVVI